MGRTTRTNSKTGPTNMERRASSSGTRSTIPRTSSSLEGTPKKETNPGCQEQGENPPTKNNGSSKYDDEGWMVLPPAVRQTSTMGSGPTTRTKHPGSPSTGS